MNTSNSNENDKTDLMLKLYQMPEIDKNILNSSFNLTMSKYLASPKCSVGFNYYIHQSYDIFKDVLNGQQKDFYWIVSGFEILLNDNDKKYELIDNMKTYFGESDNYQDKKYLIFWDIMMVNDIMNQYSNIYLHKTQSYDIFKYAIKNYHKKISEFTKNKRININFTTGSDTYDICILENDFDFNTKESESLYYKEILSDSYNGMAQLNDNGNMILRIGDIYTTPTIKLIMLFKCLFKFLYIYKPYYSRSVDSEKYIICKEFDKSKFDKINDKLKKCIKLIKNNNNEFVTDILSDMPLLPEIVKVIKYINLLISGIQHREKNKIIKYIKSDNYAGSDYYDYLDKQIRCTEFFKQKFFPHDKTDYFEAQKEYSELSNNNIKLINEFNKINILKI